MKKIIIIFSIIVILASCKNEAKIKYSQKKLKKIELIRKEEELLSIKNEFKIMQKEGKFPFKSATYNKKYLISTTYHRGTALANLFDKKGNFLARIGDVGKGPGEYIIASRIAFIDINKFYIYDGKRNLMLLYKITDKKVQFIKQIPLKLFYDGVISKIMYKNNKFYFISFWGPKSTYQVYVLDKDFNVINKFHKRKYQSTAVVPMLTITDNFMIFLGAYDFNKREHHDSNLYIYNLNDGKLFNKIDIGWKKDLKRISTDESGKYILVKKRFNKNKSIIKIFDLNGNLLNKIDGLKSNDNSFLGGQIKISRYDEKMNYVSKNGYYYKDNKNDYVKLKVGEYIFR